MVRHQENATFQKVTFSDGGKWHCFKSALFRWCEIIKKVTSFAWPRDVLINVNFPPVPKTKVTGIEITREGRRKIGDEIIESSDPRGEPYFWIGAQQHSGSTVERSEFFRRINPITPGNPGRNSQTFSQSSPWCFLMSTCPHKHREGGACSCDRRDCLKQNTDAFVWVSTPAKDNIVLLGYRSWCEYVVINVKGRKCKDLLWWYS